MKEYLQILLSDEGNYEILPELDVLSDQSIRIFPESESSARLFCSYLKKYVGQDILLRYDPKHENKIYIFSFHPADPVPYIIFDQSEVMNLPDGIKIILSLLQAGRENLFYSYRFPQRDLSFYGTFAKKPLGVGGFSEVFLLEKEELSKKGKKTFFTTTGLVAKK